MRWFRFLIRLFPSTHLASQSGEMLDSLEHAPTAFRSRFIESCSIVHASAGAWLRHSRTRQGIRGGAFFGAFVWLGLVVGIGPIRRARYEIEGLGGATQEMTAAHFSVPAAIVLVIAMTLLAWTRVGAAAVGVIGIGLAAASNRIGDFHNFDSTIYELRWLGVALLLAVALHPKQRRWLALMTAAAAVSVPTTITPPDTFWNARNYGQGYRWDLIQAIDRSQRTEVLVPASWNPAEVVVAYTTHRHYWGLQLMDIIVLAAIVFLLLAPWFTPALAATILPIAAHWAFIEPFGVQIVLLAYVSAAIYLRLRYQQRTRRPAPIT